MKKYKSKVFGNVRAPENFAELLKLIVTAKNVRMWRGQSNIAWPIHSSGFRRLLRDIKKKRIHEDDMVFYEEYLLKSATHQGYRFYNGRELSDMELLARLQHNGASTRLIDFSRNALVALWFAASGSSDKCGILFGADAHQLHGHEKEGEDRSYEEVTETLMQFNGAATWEPPTVSPRIAAQHSQFLYSSVVKSRIGSLKIKRKHLLCIAISQKLKKESLQILKKSFDIQKLSLFPDLSGFCAAHSGDYPQFDNERF